MCGIAGLAGKIDPRRAEVAVLRMMDQLQRRGPDDSGVAAWNRAILGHRRLSIFDLSSAGHQPMISTDGSVGIVFNGAIYNFRDLRLELERLGHRFLSATDTEVLLNGFRQWGIDGLVSRIDGMFSFGIWDNSTETLFLVRDRLGVKPLVFCVAGGKLAFASTTRALKAAGFAEDLDPFGMLEFLNFGFLTDEKGIYRNIEKVGAGQIVEWKNETLSRRNYWKPPKPVNERPVAFRDAVAESESLILEAVKKRLYADVPIGALLSGGIDSTLVCWAIKELGGNVRAYSIATPDESFDESAMAEETARALGIEIDVLPFTEQTLPEVDMLTAAFSEPFACSSALGMLELAKSVSTSATVLLTGDGGDDIFLGYPEHRHFFLSEKLARRVPRQLATKWPAYRDHLPKSGSFKRLRSFLDYSSGGIEAVKLVGDGLQFYVNHALLGETLRQLPIRQCVGDLSVDSARSLLSEFLDHDLVTRFVGEYLPKVDGATMYYGLEARSPFLDSQVWDYAGSLPLKTRLQGYRLKSILREIARKRIGPEVAMRPKQGFMVPAPKWLAGPWKEEFISTITGGFIDSLGLLDSRRIVDTFSGYCTAGMEIPRQFWFIWVLEKWLRYEHGLSSAK